MNAPAARSCWGIYRELAHSPGREVDDAEILRATARRLEALGLSVTLLTPEEAAEAGDPPPLAFLMCERLPILEKLARWEESGARLVNRLESIRNTYRDRMIPLVKRRGVPFPESVLVATGEPFAFPSPVRHPLWVKRGDVHNTQEGDVVFAPDRETAARALERMAARGIGTAVLQEHVEGDLIKFYGVQSAEASSFARASSFAKASEDRSEDRSAKADPSAIAPAKAEWFQWFYHRDQRLAGHFFDAASLEQAATQAARALGLEVYGGDAIAAPSGRLVVIDVNAWPSFALYRETASERIAAHLAAVYREQAGRVRAFP